MISKSLGLTLAQELRKSREDMLYLLPQLPVKNRYTEDWIGVWARELTNLNVRFKVLGSRKPVTITKYFTDPNKALEYECRQIRALSKVGPKKILCLDIDFPGLIAPALQVLRLTNPNLRCYGYLHAGSWCNGDIFSKTPGKKLMERSMFDVFDRIFVASFYHKKKIEDYFGEEFGNVEVVGFPFYKKDVLLYVKPLPFEEKRGILVNGRMEQSNVVLIDRIREKFGTEEIIVVNAKSRGEYYNQLNHAKIVLSLKTEETFGIGVLEGFILGGVLLCPNDFAYPEVIGDARLLYDNEEDLMDKLAYLLTLKENPFQIEIERYKQAIPNMISSIRNI